MKYFLSLVAIDKDTADKEILSLIFGVDFDFENQEHLNKLIEYLKDIYTNNELGVSLLTISQITPEQLELAINVLKETTGIETKVGE